ncbi:MAG: NAD regulator, partial [Rhizobiales bacterium]|nr:NAD regulator [Hyphomicrobiales bacterium]
MSSTPIIEIGLNAAIVSVRDDEPLILVVTGSGDSPDLLPFGPFDPLHHRTMESGLRSWVSDQTGLELGYVEQLYTFGDRGRHAEPGDVGPHVVSIGYLALTRARNQGARAGSATRWQSWYAYFPWEDWRNGKPDILESAIEPALTEWAADRSSSEDEPERALSRNDRIRLWFGLGDMPWNEERALERYELLYEAGLLSEALRDGRAKALARAQTAPQPELGTPMAHDHRRILATAISRLRAKIKYRPVIFEMMPGTFTLLALQRTVESLLGLHLH